MEGGANILPIIGSGMAIKDAIEDPSTSSIVSAGLSTAFDILPILKWAKGAYMAAKGAKMVNNAKSISRTTGRSVGNIRREGKRAITRGKNMKKEAATPKPIKWVGQEAIQQAVEKVLE